MYRDSLISVILILLYDWANGSVVVSVEQGKLAGSVYRSRNGTEYHGFLGIPFARAPVHELRFELPQPPDSWKGLRDATKAPPMCVQRSPRTPDRITGSEDCLYLNVFTPVAEKSELLPVMVFIHGGAFITGNAMDFDPVTFMDYPVVMVKIQYRLGVLGFLSTGDTVVPGNNGLKDQVAALQWVRRNIANFGGDPNQVTIFGQSAGSCSVHLHLLSHLSTGLFHRAISQSGTGMAPWATVPSSLARERALTIGVLNGCSTKCVKSMVTCLKTVPATAILDSQHRFTVWNHEPIMIFPVVVEPESTVGAFLTEHPWQFNDVVNKVPWIIGINSGEGSILANKFLENGGKLAIDLNSVYKRVFPIMLYYGNWVNDTNRLSEITETLKSYYFKGEDIGSSTTGGFVDMVTDCFFLYDAVEAAYRHKDESVYFYYYDHANKVSFKHLIGSVDFGPNVGPCHGDETLLLFRASFLPDESLDENDSEVSKRLTKYWVNFAYFGNPNDKDNDLWSPIESEDDLAYLHITTKEDTMKKGLLKERHSLWKGLRFGSIFRIKENVKYKDEL